MVEGEEEQREGHKEPGRRGSACMADKDKRWMKIVIVVRRDRWGILVAFELMRTMADGLGVPCRS